MTPKLTPEEQKDRRRELGRISARRRYNANPEKFRAKARKYEKRTKRERAEWTQNYQASIRVHWDRYMRYLIRETRKRAKKKGIEHTLTCEWLLERAEKTGYRCERSGMPFVLTEKRYYPFQLSLDRVDSNLGYTQKNVKLVVLMYNYAKNIAKDDQVLEFARNLSNFSGKI